MPRRGGSARPRAAQQEGGPERLSDEAEATQVSVGHGRGGLMVGEGGACEGLAGRAGGVQRTRGVRVWEAGRWSRRGGQRGGCSSVHIQLP